MRVISATFRRRKDGRSKFYLCLDSALLFAEVVPLLRGFHQTPTKKAQACHFDWAKKEKAPSSFTGCRAFYVLR
jgi:hypothetical protein